MKQVDIPNRNIKANRCSICQYPIDNPQWEIHNGQLGIFCPADCHWDDPELRRQIYATIRKQLKTAFNQLQRRTR